MHDLVPVCFVERIRDTQADLDGLFQRDSAARDSLGKRFPFDVLHHHEVDAIGAAYVVKRTNVRMIEARDRARFLLEALAKLDVLGKMRRQNLDGHRSVEAYVSRCIDLSMPPAPMGERIS